MVHGIILGAFHLEAGARAFAQWSRLMVEDVGECFRPYLKAVYGAARHWPGYETLNAGMSSDAEVDAVIESWRPLGEPIPPNPATEEMVGDRHDAKPPPPMRIHPPWRAMAQEILRAKNPRLYRALKKEGKLGDYLDGQAFRARQAYDDLVDRMLQRHPADQTWVLMSAQEIIVRDILDPTT